jgi:hypothetical protein
LGAYTLIVSATIPGEGSPGYSLPSDIRQLDAFDTDAEFPHPPTVTEIPGRERVVTIVTARDRRVVTEQRNLHIRFGEQVAPRRSQVPLPAAAPRPQPDHLQADDDVFVIMKPVRGYEPQIVKPVRQFAHIPLVTEMRIPYVPYPLTVRAVAKEFRDHG